MSNKEISVINCIGLNESIGKNHQFNQFRFAGLRPDRAIKLIHVGRNHSISEIKNNIKKEYKINPILDIQLIYKGRVLLNSFQLNSSKIPTNAEILIMHILLGG